MKANNFMLTFILLIQFIVAIPALESNKRAKLAHPDSSKSKETTTNFRTLPTDLQTDILHSLCLSDALNAELVDKQARNILRPKLTAPVLKRKYQRLCELRDMYFRHAFPARQPRFEEEWEEMERDHFAYENKLNEIRNLPILTTPEDEPAEERNLDLESDDESDDEIE